jgi:hypothetical protein
MHRQPSCAADKRDELAAPHVLLTVRGSHPSTSLQDCRVVHNNKIDGRMAEMGRTQSFEDVGSNVRFARKRTSIHILAMSHKCHKATYAVQQASVVIRSPRLRGRAAPTAG